jgi:hypothetical protein
MIPLESHDEHSTDFLPEAAMWNSAIANAKINTKWSKQMWTESLRQLHTFSLHNLQSVNKI